jgi:hypothetical protein
MNRLILIILILVTVVAGGCGSRKNKLDHSKLIPEKELTALIADLYITDGLLTLPKIRQLYSNLDSLKSYNAVIEKNGYTKETMDRTMKYYFVKKPKRLIKIYDQVLARLSEMESRYAKDAAMTQSKVANLWKGNELYSFPDPSGTDSTDFDITVNNSGIYTLSFRITLYPDDQSVNPRITAFTCHPDSIETGKRHYLKTLSYIKDGQPHTYSLTVTSKNKSDFCLKGLFFDHDYSRDDCEIHLRIEKISYLYTSAAS